MSNDTTQIIKLITVYIYRITQPPLIVMGLIGHSLNLILFSRQNLISNSFCNYCLAASCVAIFEVLLGQVFRLLSEGYGISWDFVWLCRARFWLLYSFHLSSAGLITAATLDRFLSTCDQRKYRRFANLKVARRLIPIILIASGLFYLHILFQFSLDTQKKNDCWAPKRTPYRYFLDILFLVVHALFYPLLMGTFSFLTIYHIRQRRQMQKSHAIAYTRSNRIRDFQRMALVQTISTLVLTIPFALVKLYTTVFYNDNKSSRTEAWEDLAMSIARFLWFFHDSTTFIIYTWSSAKFRREFHQFLAEHVPCRTRPVLPTVNQLGTMFKGPIERTLVISRMPPLSASPSTIGISSNVARAVSRHRHSI